MANQIARRWRSPFQAQLLYLGLRTDVGEEVIYYVIISANHLLCIYYTVPSNSHVAMKLRNIRLHWFFVRMVNFQRMAYESRIQDISTNIQIVLRYVRGREYQGLVQWTIRWSSVNVPVHLYIPRTAQVTIDTSPSLVAKTTSAKVLSYPINTRRSMEC